MSLSLANKNAIVTGGSRGMYLGCATFRRRTFCLENLNIPYILNKIPTDGQILGIGLAIAQELARRGASVLITYVSSKPRADKAVSEIQSVAGKEAKVAAIQANSANSAEAARLVVAEAHKLFGSIDIIVNNAADGSDIDLAAVTTENFDNLFHANLLFPLLLVRESRQHLRKKARIVNISSTSARRRKLQFRHRCGTLCETGYENPSD